MNSDAESPANSSEVRNARAEAQAKLGPGFFARVLEPSPPAITTEPFFADDPVDRAGAGDNTLVLPTGLDGGTDWSAITADDPELARWAATNWLGGERRLPQPPADLTATRLALHRLGVYVIAPARHAANGKFGLRYTLGGFGTPFFADTAGADNQIRVAGTNLVHQQAEQVRVSPITTLQAAADFLGTTIDTETAAEHDSPEAGDPDEALTVTEEASRFLGDWFGMAFAALEVVRADDASVDPSRPQLWPGHFDPAIEVGDEDHRGSYGASPGDHSIDEPYLYLSIWYPDRIGVDAADPAWNAPSFTGAILKLSDFPADVDPVTVAADFWKTARDRLG
ncbi:MAG: hypothetical protein AAF531_00375 [Actinomycetota bacterium]